MFLCKFYNILHKHVVKIRFNNKAETVFFLFSINSWHFRAILRFSLMALDRLKKKLIHRITATSKSSLWHMISMYIILPTHKELLINTILNYTYTNFMFTLDLKLSTQIIFHCPIKIQADSFIQTKIQIITFIIVPNQNFT